MRCAVVIAFRPALDTGLLCWTLHGYAQQTLGADHTLQVFVGMDGELPSAMIPRHDDFPFKMTVRQFPHMGAAAVRNALVKETSPQTELLIFGNADTRPAPDMVQRHVEVNSSLPSGSMVLGSAPWDFPQGPQTVFDVLLGETTAVFFYPVMAPHRWYDFRMTWTLNLSMRRSDFERVGGFREQLRPVFYEDLDLGFRIMAGQKKLWYDPAIQVLHRHPMSFEDYLDRNELLGMMAPVFASHCSGGFFALFGVPSLAVMTAQYRAWLEKYNAVCKTESLQIKEALSAPAASLGQGLQRTRAIQEHYNRQINLKRLAFRLGFIKGLEWVEDAHWLSRKPIGLWRRAVK